MYCCLVFAAGCAGCVLRQLKMIAAIVMLLIVMARRRGAAMTTPIRMRGSYLVLLVF